ncbi:MAG: hypothetical protein ACK4UJ_01085 [Leptonema sp. (in: bacteria)]
MTEPNSDLSIDELIELRNEKIKKEKEKLIHISKIKDYIKKNDCEISQEAFETLNKKVYEILNTAIFRTKSNKRKTIKPYDI